MLQKVFANRLLVLMTLLLGLVALGAPKMPQLLSSVWISSVLAYFGYFSCVVLFSCDLDIMLESVIMSLGLMPPLIRLVAPKAHGAHEIPICPPDASITDSL